MLKYLLLWFPMLLIAIFNGLIREIFIKKYTTDIAAHQISTILLLILFGLYIHFAIQRFPLTTSSEALLLGGLWLILTLAFEFGFGRWRGNSWEVLLAEYNLGQFSPLCIISLEEDLSFIYGLFLTPLYFFRRHLFFIV